MVGKLVRFAVFSAITLGITLWIGAQIAKVNFDSRYELSATFDDVAGLFAGDDVKLAGVVVGAVTGIDVVDGRAEVSFELNDNVELPTDSEVEIRWRNLIGQRFLSVVPGTASERYEDGDNVEAAISVIDLGELVNQIGPLAQSLDPNQLNEIFLSLVQAFEGNSLNFDSLIADLQSAVSNLNARGGTISQLVVDYETITAALASRDQQIQTVVDNLVLLAGAFNENSDVVERALVEFGTFSTNLDIVLDDNVAALSNILTNLSAVTDVAVAHLPELEAALLNLPGAFTELFDTVNDGQFVDADLLCVQVEPEPCSTEALDPIIDGLDSSAAGQAAPASTGGPAPNATGAAGELLRVLLGVR